MNIDLQVRYVTDSNEVLCFMHAVQVAFKDHVDITVQIDNFEDEHDMRSTQCVECERLRSMGVKSALDSTGRLGAAEFGGVVDYRE